MVSVRRVVSQRGATEERKVTEGMTYRQLCAELGPAVLLVVPRVSLDDIIAHNQEIVVAEQNDDVRSVQSDLSSLQRDFAKLMQRSDAIFQQNEAIIQQNEIQYAYILLNEIVLAIRHHVLDDMFSKKERNHLRINPLGFVDDNTILVKTPRQKDVRQTVQSHSSHAQTTYETFKQELQARKLSISQYERVRKDVVVTRGDMAHKVPMKYSGGSEFSRIMNLAAAGKGAFNEGVALAHVLMTLRNVQSLRDALPDKFY